MSILIITGDRNSHGKRDYTGAFKPEADRLAAIAENSHTIRVDVSRSMTQRRKQLFKEIDSLSDKTSFTDVAIFCHGWSTGLQCGIRSKDTDDFANAIAPFMSAGGDSESPMVVSLYACLAGNSKTSPGGDGGIADLMRDSLCKTDFSWCRVFSHTTKGHTTRNPYVRVFDGKGSTVGGVDGDWMIRPPKSGRRSTLWSIWRDALWSKGPFSSGTMRGPHIFVGAGTRVDRRDFRFYAPYMTTEELHEVLTTCR